MKREIAVILSVAENVSENLGVIERWWQWTQFSHAKSIVNALLEADGYQAKVLTNESSSLANEIRSWDCETKTDIDFSNGTNLNGYLKGVAGVFLITGMNYRKNQPLNDEVEVGRKIAKACLDAGVAHVIYSSLAHVSACIGLRSDVCDAKAHISDYMDKVGLPKTILYLPFMYEDFLFGFMKPMSTDRANIFRIIAPIGHIPMDMMAMEDVGKCVKKLFDKPAIWAGKTVALSGDKMTLEEYATKITDITYPTIIRDGKVTPDEFLSIFDGLGAEDMANYFDYMTHAVQKNNLATTMSLYEDVIPFYDWVRRNKNAFVSISAALEKVET